MDAMIAKLISSREKSIKVLEQEVRRLQELISSSASASVSVAFMSIVEVKRQRLEKLRRELDGFKIAAAAQLEVPGTEAIPPKKAK